ncbi:hypothetical protein [Hyphomicrobium sp.]|uniref:hypothetical protein n=1 Tax=Hyphomicrobium sp. TaxID=82 RepID=UPI001D1C95B3|nr:hypothetical protein [Hyphomicrobium sp.]MBY0561529.1 hypothetical protein [Hyphomicrobium sp.]
MSPDEIKNVLAHPPRGVPQSIASVVMLESENFPDMSGSFADGARWACQQIIDRADRADELCKLVASNK